MHTPHGPGPRRRSRSTADAGTSGPLSGQVLGERYRLLTVIGEGGMGTVYLAEHTAIGKKLAIKVLAAEFAEDETYRRRFLREAQAISQISHENVIDVTDFGVTPQGSLYLVMELLEGSGLADVLRNEGALPWPRAKTLLLQICAGLQAAHDRGILHRDIKPENCFLTQRGTGDFVKVLDFGLAKILGAPQGLEVSLTGTGRVIGTAEYMSPEHIRGETLDVRSEVYALGILAYELVTGCVPFAAETYPLVMDQQLYAEPVPPRQIRSELPSALDQAILRALEKQRERRFASVADLAAAVAAIDDPPSVSLPASPLGASSSRSYTSVPGRSTSSSEVIRRAAQRSREALYLGIIVVLTAIVLSLAMVLAAYVLGWID